MVRTSNWPPFVAISVVTRWRRTFSSSVPHFTVASGFLAVNSLVNPCMRIMSPLFTVAIVSVVCAIEGAEPNRVTAPKRAPRACFTVTSLKSFCVEHMPTSCNYVHTGLQPCQGVDRRYAPRRGQQTRTDRRPRRGCCNRARKDGRQGRGAQPGPPGGAIDLLLLQYGACRRLVGDQAVDQ